MKKKISDEKLKDTCKIGQGHKCCRYIISGFDGILCAKLTVFKEQLDEKVNNSELTAIGDNCEGQ